MEDIKETQRQECIRRLEMLTKKYDLCKNILKEFKKDNTIYYSENGFLYWLSNKQEYVDIIKNFEKKYGAMVYFTILSHTDFGDILNIFYVSKEQEEWYMDIDNIRNSNYSMVYAENLSEPIFSEFGTIIIAEKFGSLERVG